MHSLSFNAINPLSSFYRTRTKVSLRNFIITVNILVVTLTSKFLTRKSISFILDSKETFDTGRYHHTSYYSALQNPENPVLVTYTCITTSKCVVLYVRMYCKQGKKKGHSFLLLCKKGRTQFCFGHRNAPGSRSADNTRSNASSGCSSTVSGGAVDEFDVKPSAKSTVNLPLFSWH